MVKAIATASVTAVTLCSGVCSVRFGPADYNEIVGVNVSTADVYAPLSIRSLHAFGLMTERCSLHPRLQFGTIATRMRLSPHREL
jgi:hypothetical protein